MLTHVHTVTTFNTFDYCVIATIALSALASFRQGLTKEILSIGAWAAASASTLYCLPYLRDYGRDIVGNAFIGDILTGVVIFIATFITCSFIIQNISSTIRSSSLNGLDRSLGLVFGIARAGLLIILLFFASSLVWKTPHSRPYILKTSRTLPIIAANAKRVAHLIPQAYLSNDFINKITKSFEFSPQEIMFQLANPTPKDIDSGSDKKPEYKNDQRRDMNRLFQNYAE